MNGESLVLNLNKLILESSSSSFIDLRTSYAYIYEAARELARRTKTLTSTTSIETVISQRTYDLPSDFTNLYFRDDRNRFIIKYTTTLTGANYWIPFRQYDAMYESDNDSNVAVPDTFSITDEQTLKSRITGTASAAGAEALGECTITDTSSSTKFATVGVGDNVSNITDGSSGLVIEKTSDTALVTAMFGGTTDEWTSGDSYVIVPQTCKQIVIDPPPSAVDDVIYIPYLQEPPPVFSPYRTYRIDDQYEFALSYYAAWMYKYRDSKPDYGDRWYKLFDDKVRKATKEANKMLGRNTFRVNLRKTSFGDRSMR